MRKSLNRVLATIATGAMVASMLVSTGPVLAASAMSPKDTLSREKISVAGVTHTLNVNLPSYGSATGTQIVFNYTASGFVLVAAGSAAVTGGTGTANFVVSATDVVITCTAGTCGGFTTVSFTGTNPGTSGSKSITISGSAGIDGSFAIPIVDDDQITVTATVDPSITFNAGAEATGTPCTTTFSANGGTVALGTLTTSAITSSDVSSINHICTRVSTNATSGAIVTVKSASNNGLVSTSVPGDTIPSASAAMVIGTANYGLCASGTVTGLYGTTPTGATPTSASPFNSACVHTTAAGTVGALTTTAQTVWSVSGPVSNGYYKLDVKAAISGTTKAHSDYTDTLTFVATGTF